MAKANEDLQWKGGKTGAGRGDTAKKTLLEICRFHSQTAGDLCVEVRAKAFYSDPHMRPPEAAQHLKCLLWFSTNKEQLQSSM